MNQIVRVPYYGQLPPMISGQKSSYSLDSRLGGNDNSARSPVIPAYAGIQIRHSLKHAKTVLLNSLKL